MSEPLMEKRIYDLGRAFAMKAIELIYEASIDLVLGYGLVVVFLLGIGLALSGDIISVPVMHPA